MDDALDMERTCIVTRRRTPPEGMIRFVRAPDGALAPDIRARLPGRGVWVTARAALVAEAARKQLFSRGLKEKVTAPAQLADDVDRLLTNDCLQMLALANKAGLAVAGYGKVAEALSRGNVAALLEACDGAADGRRKMGQVARRAAEGGGRRAATIAIFTSEQLDLALGRTNVIHAALADGGLTRGFIERAERLASYRGGTQDGEAECARTADMDEAGEPAGVSENDANGANGAQDRKLDE